MHASIFLVTSTVFLFTQIFFTTGSIASGLDERIYNGYPAEIANTKHQVSIRMKLVDSFIFGLGHICGGSLISPSIVLTAAHCLRSGSSNVPFNATQLVVVMGTLARNVRTNDTLVYDVKSYVSHRNYNRTDISYDIAYIILDGEVPANHPTVAQIELVNSTVPVDTLCQVTGWGYTEAKAPSDILRTVDIPVIDINVCNRGYEGALRVVGQICAGYMEGGKDACSGDSGGPLVCNGKLTGIVSFGEGCAMENRPGIYTDVLFFQDWIERLNLERKLELLTDQALKCDCTKHQQLSLVSLVIIVVISKWIW